MKSLITAFMLVTAGPLFASDKENLILSIEAAGTNTFEDERHSVEINGCQMTTYRWRNRPDHGWVLWSSFQFDMADAKFRREEATKFKAYHYSRLDLGPPENGLLLLDLRMKDGSPARFEKPFLRPTDKKTWPSPRGDGTTHYFYETDQIIVIMQGFGLDQKGRDFTEGFKRYVREYCTFSS